MQVQGEKLLHLDTPMGCYSQVNEDKNKIYWCLFSWWKQIRVVIEDDLAKGKKIAHMAAEEIKS